MENEIVLNKIIVKKNIVFYEYDIPNEIQHYFDIRYKFYFEYNINIDFSNVPDSILAIPFVMNFLPVAWVTNSKIRVRSLDKDYFDSIDNIIKGYRMIHKNISFQNSVYVETLESNTYSSEEKSVVLFSGGVDALSTVVTHITEMPTLINIWGADLSLEDIQGHSVINRDLKNIASNLKLDYFHIKSSLRYMYIEAELEKDFKEKMSYDTWWHGMQHSVGMLSLLAPYNYMKRIKIDYIASSFTPETYIDKNNNEIIPCTNYPFIDNELKMSSVEVYHDGFEMSRMDKIQNIINYFEKEKNKIELKVCFHPRDGKNCSSCEKCYRTICGIMALGLDPNEYGFSVNQKKIFKIRLFLTLNMLDPCVLVLWEEISETVKSNQNPYFDIGWLASFKYNKANIWYIRIINQLKRMIKKIIGR